MLENVFISGTKPYLLGNEPSTVDCSLFAFLCQVLFCMAEDNALHAAITEKHMNLKYYVDRVRSNFWKDWDELLAKEGEDKKNKEAKEDDKAKEDEKETEEEKEEDEKGADKE